MNTVYVDVVFIVNFCIDYFLLYLTSVSLFIKIRHGMLVLASIIGGIYAVIISVTSPSFALRIVTILVTYHLMIVLAFGKKSIAFYIKLFTIFFAFSTLLGGFLTLVVQIANSSCVTFIILLLAVVIFGILLRFAIIILRQDTSSVIKRVKIIISGNEAEFTVLSDSGNRLTDPLNGNPVVLLQKKCRRCFNIDSGIEDKRYIQIRTVNALDESEIVIPDEVIVDKFRVKASVCFLESDCFCNDGFDGIIPSILTVNQ